MPVLLILTYLAAVLFVVLVVKRAIRIISAPLHLRWEIYPVPHEKGKSHYGGSRLEDLDWWEKPLQKNSLNELTVMIPEILFLKGVWEHNKALWIGSFPFHFALYLLSANIGLLILNAILVLSGSVAEPYNFVYIVNEIIVWFAWIASIIGTLGGLRLLIMRMTDKGLRTYSTASHYFNIMLITAIYITLFGWLAVDANATMHLTEYYKALITFNVGADIVLPAIAYWHIGITIFFMAYLPLTHMTHFFTKYFTYHKIRWEDEPNMPGAKMQGEIEKLLNQNVSWAAPHIGTDGTKNWLAIATSAPTKEEKNDKKN